MNGIFLVVKFKKLLITVFVVLMLLYVAYVCYSVFFSGYKGVFV